MKGIKGMIESLRLDGKLSQLSPGPELARKIMDAREARASAKAAAARTCLSCGASAPVQADGSIPEEGLPCGH